MLEHNEVAAYALLPRGDQLAFSRCESGATLDKELLAKAVIRPQGQPDWIGDGDRDWTVRCRRWKRGNDVSLVVHPRE